MSAFLVTETAIFNLFVLSETTPSTLIEQGVPSVYMNKFCLTCISVSNMDDSDQLAIEWATLGKSRRSESLSYHYADLSNKNLSTN